jgi:hypothetical protein
MTAIKDVVEHVTKALVDDPEAVHISETIGRGSILREEQDVMRRLVGESILPSLELDISVNDITRAADRIADWLEETGGLWA